MLCVYNVTCSGLELTYQGVIIKGNSLIIKDIVALGTLSSSLGKVLYIALCYH